MSKKEFTLRLLDKNTSDYTILSMSRILCLDYGERRTGVAISDETKTIAQSLTTIVHQNETELITAVAQLVAKYEVDLIIIGLPLSLSGKPSTRSEKIRAFAERLAKRVHLPVELFDERFSTDTAQATYAEVYGKPHRGSTFCHRKTKCPIDRIAATIILKNYLASLQNISTKKKI